MLHLGLRQVRSELDDVLVMSNRIGPVGSETLRILNSLPREALANCLRKSTWHGHFDSAARSVQLRISVSTAFCALSISACFVLVVIARMF